jgi:hypothetical protein
MTTVLDLINRLYNSFLKLEKNVEDLNDRYLINIVFSKLDFAPKNYKIIRKYNDNMINIKCHNYFSNIENNNDKEILLEYEQDKCFNNNSLMPPPQYYNEIINNIDCYKHMRKLNIFICIQYADITIDLNAKRYNIKQSYFNIRKPTTDENNLFSDIVNNIDNPDYYFINNNNSNIIKIDESDIYFIPENIIYTNDIKKIIIKPIMPITNTISNDIDIKPLLSNQIRVKDYNGIFI